MANSRPGPYGWGREHRRIRGAYGRIYWTHGRIYWTHGRICWTHGRVYSAHGRVYSARGRIYWARGAVTKRHAAPRPGYAMTHDHEPVGFDAGPADPFLGDPADPAALFDDIDPAVPLTAEERADVEDDLAELLEFQAALAPIGFRGVVVDCADCAEPHFFSWSLMLANLRSLLGVGVTQPHEPAFSPDTNTFVSWDYARGYTDALTRN